MNGRSWNKRWSTIKGDILSRKKGGTFFTYEKGKSVIRDIRVV